MENKDSNEKNQLPAGEYLIVKPHTGELAAMPNFNEFFEGMMKFQYGDSTEESDEGFQQMLNAVDKNQGGDNTADANHFIIIPSSIDSLFDQVKDLEGPLGPRLSGEPEILHEIEDYFRQVEFYPVVRDQIRRILEYVPKVFPENWESPEGFDQLNQKQQEAYRDIAQTGLQGCPGPIIQQVIKLGLDYRQKYGKDSQKKKS